MKQMLFGLACLGMVASFAPSFAQAETATSSQVRTEKSAITPDLQSVEMTAPRAARPARPNPGVRRPGPARPPVVRPVQPKRPLPAPRRPVPGPAKRWGPGHHGGWGRAWHPGGGVFFHHPGWKAGWRWNRALRPRWFRADLRFPAFFWEVNVPAHYYQCIAFKEGGDNATPYLGFAPDVDEAAFNALDACGGADACYIPENYCQLK